MPDIDLEPDAYRVNGRKEPILAKGWWIGILTIVAIFLFAMFVYRPLFGVWADFFDTLWPRK